MQVLDAVIANTDNSSGVDGSQDLRKQLTEAVLADPQDPAAASLANSLRDFLEEEGLHQQLSHWFGANTKAAFSDPPVLKALLARDIAAIDTLLGDQIDAILHHADFKRLEATWRGVDLVIDELGNDDKARVRILNATWLELSRDFDRAAEFDQSILFAKIYNEEYGMPGGTPYGLLICDYAVRHRATPGGPMTDDVNTLIGLSQVAAAAFSPCVVGAAPELFGVSSFADLSYAQRLDTSFRLTEYHRWARLREREESKFLGVALPRILLRDRYNDSSARRDGFRYVEGGSDIDSWLWGNAAFAFGAIAIRAYRDYGWFADICGTHGPEDRGGVLSTLPAPYFSSGEDVAYRRPLEVELTDKKQKALEDLGFIAISPCSFTRSVVFLGAESLHQIGSGLDEVTEANSRLSGMLPHVMCISRFAHYVKVMARDRVGAYTTPQDLERYLDNWLREYTIGNTDAGPELKARYPLAGAKLELREVPGKPGKLNCVMHLQPHFQFDQVVSNLQLRTEIASTGVR